MFPSWGCPFNCCFCSIHLHMGKKLRVHSAKQVLEHITHVTQKYGVNHIHFEDDNLTFPKKRFVAILDGIINNGLNFTWDTPNGIRADNLGKNILTKMKQSGCVHLTIAPESGVQSVLNNIINKRLELSEVIETAKHAKEVGLPLHAFFVLGCPGETIRDMEKTMDFAEMLSEKFDVTPGISVATPLYGTRLHRECEEKGYLLSELTPKTLSESTQGKGIIKTEDFDPEDIKFLIEKADNKRLQLKLEKHSQKIKQQFRKYGIAGKLMVILWLSPRFSYIRTILKPLKKRFRKSSFTL
ncbi:MAG: radical SAM protein [Bacteroidales bacterium]|nr:radical SAM protein [Bacteroidales bacterium]